MTVAEALAEGLFLDLLEGHHPVGVAACRHAAFVELKAHTAAGCSARVAFEFGDRPDTAAARMAQARLLLAGVR